MCSPALTSSRPGPNSYSHRPGSGPGYDLTDDYGAIHDSRSVSFAESKMLSLINRIAISNCGSRHSTDRSVSASGSASTSTYRSMFSSDADQAKNWFAMSAGSSCKASTSQLLRPVGSLTSSVNCALGTVKTFDASMALSDANPGASKPTICSMGPRQ